MRSLLGVVVSCAVKWTKSGPRTPTVELIHAKLWIVGLDASKSEPLVERRSSEHSDRTCEADQQYRSKYCVSTPVEFCSRPQGLGDQSCLLRGILG